MSNAIDHKSGSEGDTWPAIKVGGSLTPLLTEKEAASALGWSISALQQRRFRGQQPNYLKLGGKSVRYELDTLKAFIEQGRVSLQGVS